MKISVLIATYERAALLEKCLIALAQSTRPADEIVIADQSRDDATEKMVRGFPAGPTELRYLHVAPPGKSRALNHAIRASSGDPLALTDDDVEVDPRWLETIETLVQRYSDVVAFCGRVLPEPGSDPADYLNMVLETEERWITRRTNPLNLGFCGADAVVRRAALLEAGGYDEHFGPGGRFRNNDDGDLAYRLTRNGGRVRYSPELSVFHSAWRKDADNDSLKYDYAYSLGALAGYYLRRAEPRASLYLAKRVFHRSRRWLGARLRGRTRLAGTTGVELRGACGGFLHGLRTAETGTMARTGEHA